MKQVEYFGITYQVPDETVAIATDMDGGAYSYIDSPTPMTNSDGGWWIGNADFLSHRKDLSGAWDSSLMIIENINGECDV